MLYRKRGEYKPLELVTCKLSIITILGSKNKSYIEKPKAANAVYKASVY